jgi:uncharacterized protein YycO
MAIPLDPGAGGRSIDARALRMSDIIVSTTGDAISRGIRLATRSAVSHSMLYIGYNQVVEAIGSGVVLRSLEEAIRDAILAVAYRHPDLNSVETLKVRNFVGLQLDKRYNYAGIVQHAARRGCILAGPIACIAADRVQIKRDEFFCSELVFAAYKSIGKALSDTEPGRSDPGNIPTLFLKKALDYIGHLKA